MLSYGRPRNPGLAAFLAQTPESAGGAPQTAPPDQLGMPGGDPLAQPPAGGQPKAPKAPAPSKPGGSDAYQTALLADIQQSALRDRRLSPGLSYFLS